MRALRGALLLFFFVLFPWMVLENFHSFPFDQIVAAFSVSLGLLLTPLRRKLLFALFATLMVLGLFEGLLRIAGFEYTPFIAYYGIIANLGDPTIHDLDPVEFWKPRPNPESEVSSQGFRSPELAVPKPEGTFRIACLGDSSVFGYGIDAGSAFCALVGSSAAARSTSMRIETLNAGVMGYSSYQGLQRLRRDVLSFEPNLLLVYFGWNDRKPAYYYSDREQKVLPGMQGELAHPPSEALFDMTMSRLRTYQLLKYVIYRATLASDVAEKLDVPEGRAGRLTHPGPRVPTDEFHRNLEEMATLGAQQGFKVLFLEAIMKKDGRVEAVPGVRHEPSVSLAPAMLAAGCDPAKRCMIDSAHPNRDGHRAIAKGVFDDLLARGWLPP